MPKKAQTAKNEKTIAIGRRKTSMAMATVVPGNGEIIVNKQAASLHFPGANSQKLLVRPLEITQTMGKYNIFIHTAGGGKTGQLDASALAIARSLIKIDPTFRAELRKAGLLTRDSRERQTRMVGTGGKARRQKQSPKR